MAAANSLLDHLECTRCAEQWPAGVLTGLCPCGGPLLARYRLRPGGVAREILLSRPFTQWRYRELLPAVEPVTLGEGGTPLLPLRRLGAALGVERLQVKDEAANPTGSFKARGLSAAVSVARHLGVRVLAIPSAGNAGSALAAYGAAAGLSVHVFLPRDTPPLFFQEIEGYGAAAHPVDGTIRDCARALTSTLKAGEYFDLSTLREPYRVEGKKTMGYEIAEQMGWKLPDWILYPTGGGTGLIGMVKAFQEMQSLGWISGPLPRMVAVQAAGCAPIVRAFTQGKASAVVWANPVTRAWGLRVPGPLGDALILKGVRDSGGAAVAIPEEAMFADARELASREGIFAGPEGGATLSALKMLLSEGRIRHDESVVLFNTGTGLKYL